MKPFGKASNRVVQRVVSAVGLSICIATAPPAIAQSGDAKSDLSGYKATALETMRLPQYCWGTFNPQFRGKDMGAYNLPGGCGEHMGHYCPGLLSLSRAKKASGNRDYWIGVAYKHMEYTVDRLPAGSSCPLSADIQKYWAEVRALRKGGGR